MQETLKFPRIFTLCVRTTALGNVVIELHFNTYRTKLRLNPGLPVWLLVH